MRFLIPEKGVSALDVAGPAPSTIRRPTPRLFGALEETLVQTDRPPADPAAASHQRPAFCRGAGRSTSTKSRKDELRNARASRARKSSKNSATWSRPAQPIVGGGAGTGLSAKCEEAGGIDLIIIYNSGRYRMAGRGSAAGLLAYGNANEIVKEMARRGAAGGEAHAGARRRQRHRSVRADAAIPRRAEDHGLFRRAEFSDHRPVRRRDARRASRKPAWASGSRST